MNNNSQVSKEDLVKINQFLENLKEEATRDYNKLNDAIEERDYYLKKRLEDSTINAAKADFFQEQRSNLFKRANRFDEDQADFIGMLNKEIGKNEEQIEEELKKEQLEEYTKSEESADSKEDNEKKDSGN